DIRALQAPIARLGVDWIVRDEPATLALVHNGVTHGCDVCSRHRRRALYRVAAELGCTTLALGHTADDCAESLPRNILFNGRIASLPPVAVSRKGTLRLVRPLVFVTEELTAAYAQARGLSTVGCACSDKAGVRSEIREFLTTLRARHPGVAESVAAALGNVNPYTLFDPALEKAGAALPPAFETLRTLTGAPLATRPATFASREARHGERSARATAHGRRAHSGRATRPAGRRRRASRGRRRG